MYAPTQLVLILHTEGCTADVTVTHTHVTATQFASVHRRQGQPCQPCRDQLAQHKALFSGSCSFVTTFSILNCELGGKHTSFSLGKAEKSSLGYARRCRCPRNPHNGSSAGCVRRKKYCSTCSCSSVGGARVGNWRRWTCLNRAACRRGNRPRTWLRRVGVRAAAVPVAVAPLALVPGSTGVGVRAAAVLLVAAPLALVPASVGEVDVPRPCCLPPR